MLEYRIFHMIQPNTLSQLSPTMTFGGRYYYFHFIIIVQCHMTTHGQKLGFKIGSMWIQSSRG